MRHPFPDPARPEAPARGWLAIRRLPRLTCHHVADPRWTLPPMTAAVIADLHVGMPWVSPDLVGRIVEQVNALRPDIIFLAGDLLLDRNMWWFSRVVPAAEIVAILSALRAPLGAWSILGNHDWGDCDLARDTGGARNSVIEAHAAHGLPLLRNEARHIPHGPGGFWLVGTDSQRAGKRRGRGPDRYVSHLDAEAAFAAVPAGAPAIHLAHEPDWFARGDPRAFLQVSGHTHGGQIRLFGRTPAVPSAFGSRYAGGHVRENGNHLIVSRGIGYSGLPLRLGVPPEIVLLTVTGT
ncbi:metallophosphoesterase [Mangrovicoccus algicola]|uniref:Metallophosphoesterase n=1 Tax=Mangrovicoccus algicola TaxID=2771008 RepID=A0A8J7D0M9_9RHOB|nr:metallophosphoesterase [Mangrovicoccus algicola]MBE3639673.1 metallophosphoesterase [Mangrovicoccus algicola]